MIEMAPETANRCKEKCLKTGPKAKDFIADVKAVKIEPAGEGEGGFAKCGITL